MRFGEAPLLGTCLIRLMCFMIHFPHAIPKINGRNTNNFSKQCCDTVFLCIYANQLLQDVCVKLEKKADLDGLKIC